MKYAVSQLTFFRVHVKISLAIKNRFRRRQNVYIAEREESQHKKNKKDNMFVHFISEKHDKISKT